MVRIHEFNTAWWEAPAGVIDSAAFFDMSQAEQRRMLEAFEWVEFHTASPDPRTYRRLRDSGFVFGDAQLRLRLELRSTPAAGTSGALDVTAASERPFEVQMSAVRVFESERFFLLPGVSQDRVAARYALWAGRLLRESPETCFRASLDGATQGWFLGKPAGAGVELTLAMLTRSAGIVGYALYAAAVAKYAERGYRIGVSSYSYRHTAVGYIFATLGARITAVRETWIWVHPQLLGRTS